MKIIPDYGFCMPGLLPLALLAISCSGISEPDPPAPRLVVEGWIDSGGYPDVMLNLSIVPGESEGSVVESVVKWGYVTISDGEREVVLTGGMDNDYFPPYHYYNFDMTGEPGRTYTLKAVYKGMTAVSTVTMPSPTPIDGIELTPAEGCDTLRHMTLDFTAPDDCPAYYHLSVQIEGQDGRPYPCMLGAHEVTVPGTRVTLPVYSGSSNPYTGKYAADMPVGKMVTVRLSRVSEEVFRFWRAFDNASLVAGSVFVGAPGSLPSNISGGYGVWSPQATASCTVKVE